MTQTKLVPTAPTDAMLDRAVAFALNVSISREYTWTDYMRDLWTTMLAGVASDAQAPLYQIGANAGGGIAWWDVDKDRYEREKKAGYMKTGIVYREGE